jgi:hypothetical protein
MTNQQELQRISVVVPWNLKIGASDFLGIWDLAFGAWDFLGTWDLEFGLWDLEFGISRAVPPF